MDNENKRLVFKIVKSKINPNGTKSYYLAKMPVQRSEEKTNRLVFKIVKSVINPNGTKSYHLTKMPVQMNEETTNRLVLKLVKLNNNPDGTPSFQLKTDEIIKMPDEISEEKNNLNEKEDEKSSVAITAIKQEKKPEEKQDEEPENPEEPDKPDEPESETDKSENNDDKNSTQPENESDNQSEKTSGVEESTSDQEKETKFGIVTVKKREDLIADPNGSFTTMANMVTNGDYHRCDVCLHICATIEDLEQHKSSSSHYVCNIGPKCTIGFSSQAELTKHQAEHQDQHPVQQMVQQVERIPFNYNYRQISNQVMLTPVAQKRSLPPPETPPVAKRPQIKLPDSITLVKNPPASNVANVANIFATRGVTVVPSSSARRAPLTAPRTLLNSSVSITPSRKTSNLPTVDLTKEIETPRRRVVTPQKRIACQICDKVFPSQEILSTHMATHRTQRQRTFECELCTAQYPSAQGLETHKQKFHRNRSNASPAKPQQPSPEMALPVVDIRTPGIKQKLLQVGIRHVLLLSQLQSKQGSASFGLPIVPVDTANNQAFCSLGDIGISNILPLGPLQTLQR